MKLRELELKAFRGAPRRLVVRLKPTKSHFFYSENGRGKSTIADAFEFLTTGGLARFTKEECGIDAAINLRAGEDATVAAKLADPDVSVKRALDKDGPSDLESDIGDLEPIPTLRQATIVDFMAQTAGEKRQALLELLDLDALNDFRGKLRTALGKAKDRKKSAKSTHKEEVDTLEGLLNGKDLLHVAAKYAEEAGVKEEIDSPKKLEKLELRPPPGEPNRQPALTELVRALAAVSDDDPSADWNAAVADIEVRRGEALSVLLSQGSKVLAEVWPDQSCPLCEADQDHDALADRVETRAKALAESNQRLNNLRQRLEVRRTASSSLEAAIAGVLRVAPKDGWPSGDELGTARDVLKAHAETLKKAGHELSAAPQNPDLGMDLEVLIPKLQEASVPKQSPEIAALQRLVEIRGVHSQVAKRLAKYEKTKEQETSLKRLLEIADETIKSAVEESLSEIEGLVARYFEILMADPIYTNVKLVYAARRSGQVEFSIDFSGDPVKPPQRIMSESQLNALGLALLLARVKSGDTPWQTLVLDDVVNSFDSPHRVGLIRLLKQEFVNWQIVIFSHDSVFRDIAQREAGEWSFQEIIVWTPDGGPILGEGDPLNRLQQELDGGAGASALGGHARRALEQKLGKVVAELGCRIAYDPGGRYTAHDLLQALTRELKEKQSPLAEHEVLKRMDTASYMATRTVHTRTDLPEATTDDLKRLAADAKDLDEVFRCDECDKWIWFAESETGHQCKCGTLTV
jgi:hypothetical protein